MKYLKQFFKQHKGKTLLAAFLLLGQVIGTLLIPALIANVVDDGILRNNMKVIASTGLQMVLVAIAGSGVAIWGSWATSDLGALFGRDMRTKLFQKAQDLSIAQFNDLGVSSMITRSTSDITNLQQTLGMMLQMVAPAPIIVAVSMIMTAMVSPLLALIQFLFMVTLIGFSALLLHKSNKLSQTIQIYLDRINQTIREAITGVRVIRAFGNEQYEEKRSAKAYRTYAENMIALNRLFAAFTPAVWILMGALMVVILGVGGGLSLQGTMKVGQITAVIEYAILTMGYLLMAMASLSTLPKARACLVRLQEVLDTPLSVTDSEASAIGYTRLPTEPVAEFKHVTFSYPGAEEPVLCDLSFSVYPGRTTAIIGSTGSGKSTLADLLLRLHDIQAGSIKLKGMDIRRISQQKLREKIGCVPQKSFLFSGTIADNLRMGHPEADESALWEALSIAQADDFVKKLPLGLDSPVSQGGTNFSGGQRQRLSIARALVKQADILLFDDSFSALDVKTDAALRHNLHINKPDIAKLIIAQRVSSIVDADQILVLNEGELAGIGTHQELMKTCSIYQSIAQSQMSRKEA